MRLRAFGCGAVLGTSPRITFGRSLLSDVVQKLTLCSERGSALLSAELSWGQAPGLLRSLIVARRRAEANFSALGLRTFWVRGRPGNKPQDPVRDTCSRHTTKFRFKLVLSRSRTRIATNSRFYSKLSTVAIQYGDSARQHRQFRTRPWSERWAATASALGEDLRAFRETPLESSQVIARLNSAHFQVQCCRIDRLILNWTNV